jgi:hypothetical protein
LSRLELKWSDLDSFQKDCLLLPNNFLILTVDFSFNEMAGLMVDVSILRAHNIRISFNAWLTCFGRPQHGTKVFEMLDDFLIGDLEQ